MTATRRNRRPGAVLLWLLIAVPIVVYVLNPFGATVKEASGHLFGHTTFRVPSKSMAPTIPPGTFVLADVRATAARAAQRGDIVVYHRPGQPEPLYVSRLVAVGGDRIAVRGRVVEVNGAALDEPYAAWLLDPHVDVEDQVVPDGAVFLLGDNRSYAEDSRFIGPIPRSDLNGVVRRRW